MGGVDTRKLYKVIGTLYLLTGAVVTQVYTQVKTCQAEHEEKGTLLYISYTSVKEAAHHSPHPSIYIMKTNEPAGSQMSLAGGQPRSLKVPAGWAS